MAIAPNGGDDRTSTTLSRSSNANERKAWLAQRMQAILEMYPGASLSQQAKAQYLFEWELILDDVGPVNFDHALTRHVREGRFFPTVAELRERAGMSKADQDALEANLAWVFINDYVHKHWHPDLGALRNAPKIPWRTEYALRQIGGRRTLHDCLRDRLAFMRRDFLEAYRLAPLAADAEQLQLVESREVMRGFLERAKRQHESEPS